MAKWPDMPLTMAAASQTKTDDSTKIDVTHDDNLLNRVPF